MNNILKWFLDWWIFTVPISLYLIYTVVTELLDFLFNSKKINSAIKHGVDIDKLESVYDKHKERQLKVDSSNLKQMEMQVNYKRTIGTKKYPIYWGKEGDIVNAKELSDIFKFRAK